MTRERTDLPRDSDGKLTAYAWPGGYPVLYVMSDGETMCPACANGENGSLARVEPDLDDPGSDRSWLIAGYDVYYEGPDEYCAHCNAAIPSAYGDPDSDPDTPEEKSK